MTGSGRATETTATILQLVLIDETGDSYYRMRWPGALLSKQQPDWRIINLDAGARERFTYALEADLLVLYQSSDLDLMPLLKARKAAGRKTLVEYNDNFYEPPPSSPVAREWSSPLLWQTYESFMRCADGIIVTGPGLKKLFSATYEAEIFVLENQLPEMPPAVSQLTAKKSGSEIRLGWAGSLGHIADLLSTTAVVRKLLNEFPQLTLHCMGNESIPGLLGLPSERFRFTPWGTMKEYFSFWEGMHIGLAPLLDTPYNECRSDIKAVEMSSRCVAPVLADRLPYRAFIDRCGLSPFRNSEELYEKVKNYIQNPARMKEDAERCYRHVEDHRVGDAHFERRDLYAKFLPAERSKFSWPVSAGYFELGGTPHRASASSVVMQQVEKHIKAGQQQEARTVLERAIAENSSIPEYALTLVNFFLMKDEAAALERLASLAREFPRDLRPQLLSALCRKSAADRLDEWRKILVRLDQESEAFREYFQPEAVRRMIQALRGDFNLSAVAEDLVRIFPRAAVLRFELAEGYRRTGLSALAKVHYNWLVVEQAAFEQNQQFLSTLQRSYVRALKEGL